ERLLDRRGEHECARHERYAEHHRDTGEQEPQPVRDQTLAGELPHAQSPSVRILSRMESAVGPWSSSTIRPSVRNTTRSAYAAAVGSCVTMTIVCPNLSTTSRMKVRISAL